MPPLTTSTSLGPGGEQAQQAEAWARGVLEGWGYPGGLARRWLMAAGSAWQAGEPVDVQLDRDDDLGLVTLELLRAGRVVYGVDDFLGPPARV
jgi:hypothetical protein